MFFCYDTDQTMLLPSKSFIALQSTKHSDSPEMVPNILQRLSADDKNPRYQGKN